MATNDSCGDVGDVSIVSVVAALVPVSAGAGTDAIGESFINFWAVVISADATCEMVINVRKYGYVYMAET